MRTDQLKTGRWNSPILQWHWDSQRWIASQIHGRGILYTEHLRFKDGCTPERRTRRWQILKGRYGDEIDGFKHFLQLRFPGGPPFQCAAIVSRVLVLAQRHDRFGLGADSWPAKIFPVAKPSAACRQSIAVLLGLLPRFSERLVQLNDLEMSTGQRRVDGLIDSPISSGQVKPSDLDVAAQRLARHRFLLSLGEACPYAIPSFSQFLDIPIYGTYR